MATTLTDAQVQSAEVSDEEEQVMQTIYNILRQGTNESDAIIRHKVKLIFQKIQTIKSKETQREEWMREKRELEKKTADLQTALQGQKKGL